MKLADIVKIIATALGTSDLKEINKLFKQESAAKFRIIGKSLGHYGFTGQIKSISEEGVKVFTPKKVSLIRFEDIESFEKAKPRSERTVKPLKTKATAVAPSSGKKTKALTIPFEDYDEDDEDFDEKDGFEEEAELQPKKLKKVKEKFVGKSGSKFIPPKK
ncbi:MAG: hypothetical protein ACOYOK_12250 [Pseudobdellovibrionaceae bacterium]